MRAKRYRLACARRYFVFFSLSGLSICLAISPEGSLEEPAGYRRMAIHTSPFLVMQLGLAVLALSQVYLEHYTGYHDRQNQSEQAWANRIALALFVLVVVLKMSMTVVAMWNMPWKPERDYPTFFNTFQLVDKLFLFFAVLYPAGCHLYNVVRRGDQLEMLLITLRTICADQLQRQYEAATEEDKPKKVVRLVHVIPQLCASALCLVGDPSLTKRTAACVVCRRSSCLWTAFIAAHSV